MNAPAGNLGEGSGREVSKRQYSGFAGTSNPRHLRAIAALLRRPMPREHLDHACGCSNGPELIAELRRRELELPCLHVQDHDRDGRPIRRGVYYLTASDRRKVAQWLARGDKL